MERNPVTHPGPFKTLANQVLKLVVEFQRVKMSVLRQRRGKAYRGVAGECPKLQHALRPAHLHEHSQQFPLHTPGEHSRVVGADVGLFLDPAQRLRLLCRMLPDVSVNIFIHILNFCMPAWISGL